MLKICYYIKHSINLLVTDCPTVPILSGQYRFEGLCPESRLYLSRDNECPAIGVLEYTCSTMAAIIELQWAWRCKLRSAISIARANAALALGAIINITRTYHTYIRTYIYTLRSQLARYAQESGALFRCVVTEIKVVNHASKAYS